MKKIFLLYFYFFACIADAITLEGVRTNTTTPFDMVASQGFDNFIKMNFQNLEKNQLSLNLEY